MYFFDDSLCHLAENHCIVHIYTFLNFWTLVVLAEEWFCANFQPQEGAGGSNGVVKRTD